MTTTTHKHPLVAKADRILHRAAELCEEKWRRRVGAEPPYGIPEAVREAAGEDNVALIIAERQCVTYGLDVWWNDLLCVDGEQAARELRKLEGIAPEDIYGPMWDANLGLLILADGLTAAQLNGLANVTRSEHWHAYDECVARAELLHRDGDLRRLSEDIAFAMAHHASTPAGTMRRLKAVRALECVAAHHVLMDVLSLEQRAVLVEPVATLLPFAPIHLNGGHDA